MMQNPCEWPVVVFGHDETSIFMGVDATEAIALDKNAVLTLRRDDSFFELDRAQCKAVGQRLHDQYLSAAPYPHIVIDDFLSKDVMRQIVSEFPARIDGRFSDDFSQLKTGYSLSKIRSAYINDFLSALNSAAFIVFLEQLTGIKGLVTDAHYTGGGLHETKRGGHLSIHADFNIHPHTKLLRRLNLILFLNEEWQPEWGGDLELWDQGMKACQLSVAPVIGRAVIFNTDSNNYHGHPDPLACPPEVMRRSIALYYYSLPKKIALPHTTLFQARPGSNDVRPSFKGRALDMMRRLRGVQPLE
jgi:Rps23 Pro-64 3,4-dihydroxylase Tpa1-like proline 4-hydroxylase